MKYMYPSFPFSHLHALSPLLFPSLSPFPSPPLSFPYFLSFYHLLCSSSFLLLPFFSLPFSHSLQSDFLPSSSQAPTSPRANGNIHLQITIKKTYTLCIGISLCLYFHYSRSLSPHSLFSFPFVRNSFILTLELSYSYCRL